MDDFSTTFSRLYTDEVWLERFEIIVIFSEPSLSSLYSNLMLIEKYSEIFQQLK